MANTLLPICSQQKIAIRDGYTGPLARLLLPFYQWGYWYASGQQFTFPNSTIKQDKGITMNGTTKPNTFIKTPGICPVNV
jgi:hypothetical protein